MIDASIIIAIVPPIITGIFGYLIARKKNISSENVIRAETTADLQNKALDIAKDVTNMMREELGKEIEILRADNEKLKKKIEETESEIRSLREQLERSGHLIQTLKEEISSLNSTIKRYENQISNSKQ